jgi:hypothetical protein
VKTKSGNLLPKTLPGTICSQMIRCGKPNCKCARGELHGPYFYHFKRVNGALIKQYVKAGDVARMRAACDARRKAERQRRWEQKVNIRALIKAIEQLRGS